MEIDDESNGSEPTICEKLGLVCMVHGDIVHLFAMALIFPLFQFRSYEQLIKNPG